METLVLEVDKRTTLGKKVKTLRRTGVTPANIFGHALESQAIQVNTADLEKILAKAGANHMIVLKGAGSKKDRPVLTKGVQRDPITGKVLHIDFHQVSLKDKVKVEVPLVFKGEAPAARRKDLILLESLRSITVECLPNLIPESVEVDLKLLAEAGDHILVRDLKLGENVTAVTHPEEMIAKVEFARLAEAKVAAEAAAAPEGAAPKAGEAAAGAQEKTTSSK